MRGYLYCGEAGLVEKQEWLPNSWVNVECPDADDFDFLTKTLGVPESFLDDIADVDEDDEDDEEDDLKSSIEEDSDIIFDGSEDLML